MPNENTTVEITTLPEVTEAELTSAPEKETATQAVTEASPNRISITTEGLDWSLGIMGKGMLGIFIVTSIIVGVTVVLNKVTAPRKKKEKKDK